MKPISFSRVCSPAVDVFNPEDAARLFVQLVPEVVMKQQEVIVAMMLDCQSRARSLHVVGLGSLMACIAPAALILKLAALSDAASVIVAHNHPSGNAQLSREDRVLHHRLSELLSLIESKLLDSLVIGAPEDTGTVEWASVEADQRGKLTP